MTSQLLQLSTASCRGGEEGADLLFLVSSDRMHENGSKLSQGRNRLNI